MKKKNKIFGLISIFFFIIYTFFLINQSGMSDNGIAMFFYIFMVFPVICIFFIIIFFILNKKWKLLMYFFALILLCILMYNVYGSIEANKRESRFEEFKKTDIYKASEIKREENNKLREIEFNKANSDKLDAGIESLLQLQNNRNDTSLSENEKEIEINKIMNK